MGRSPTPLNVLNIRGSAPKKNPARIRARENAPQDKRTLGAAPRGLTDAQRQVWREIARNAVPGVLGRSDRLMVETAARLVAEVRAGEVNAALYGQMIRALALLGMSPTERTKLGLPAAKAPNPFDEE